MTSYAHFICKDEIRQKWENALKALNFYLK